MTSRMTPSKVSTSFMGSFLWGQNEGPAARRTGLLYPVYRLPAIPRKSGGAIPGFRNAIVLGARDAKLGSIQAASNKKILPKRSPIFCPINEALPQQKEPPCLRAARSHWRA